MSAAAHFPDGIIYRGRMATVGAVVVTTGAGWLAWRFVNDSGLGPAWWPGMAALFVAIAVAAIPDYRMQLQTWADIIRLHLLTDTATGAGMGY